MSFLSSSGVLLLNHEGNVEVSELTIPQAHERGVPHLHAGVALTRRTVAGNVLEVLLQQRKPAPQGQRQFGEYWCFSASGHCHGDDFLEAQRRGLGGNFADMMGMKREAHEELGVTFSHGENGDICGFHDFDGTVERVTQNKILRLWQMPEVPAVDGVNTFAERPILTLGCFHLASGTFRPQGNSDVEKFEWVPVLEALTWSSSDHTYKIRGDATCEPRKLTPWLESFLQLQFGHADDRKNWGERTHE